MNTLGSSSDTCYGSIHLGPVIAGQQPPSVPFDGLICINAGWRSATLRYVGCDDDSDGPNVWVNGTDAATYDFTQTNCTYTIPAQANCPSPNTCP